MIIMIISHCKTSPSLVIIKVSGEGDTSPDGAEKCWAAMVEVGFAFWGSYHSVQIFLYRLTGGSLKRWPSWTRRDTWRRLSIGWRGGRVEGENIKFVSIV